MMTSERLLVGCVAVTENAVRLLHGRMVIADKNCYDDVSLRDFVLSHSCMVRGSNVLQYYE